MKQADDLREEVEVLAELLAPLGEEDLGRVTQFKGWRINDVLGHLHMFDAAVLASLDSDAAFAAFFAPIAKGLAQGQTLLETQIPWLDGLSGRALVRRWHDTALQVAATFAETDPKRRLKWAGPEMSALSSLTARQMETWAHGQEIFDCLGQTRREGDRVRNICHLGVTTYGWTFQNRGQVPPEPVPFVELIGPSGALWSWGDPESTARVTGDAVAFAQVVAQTRNIADTDLRATGESAVEWMRLAQCFAGSPEMPPAPGQRHRQV